MRAGDPATVLERVVAILEGQVLAEVGTDHARASLLLACGLLDNLSTRVEESSSVRAEDTALVADLADHLPGVLRSGPDDEDSADPTGAVTRGLRELRRRRELFERQDVQAWMTTCHRALSSRTGLQIQLMRPTRYYSSQSSQETIDGVI
jgi:hypothetical protein